jgi:tetratricopeptide (TPR) repeat protein
MSKQYWESYFNAIKQQNWKWAKEVLEHLCKSEPNNPQVQLKLGDIFQRLGNTSEAIASYHKSAWDLKNQGFIQKALALYKIILRLDPMNDEALKASKDLMIDISSKKKPKTTAPFSEAPIEEGKKEEAETGFLVGLEETDQETETEAGLSYLLPSLFESLPQDEMKHLIEKTKLQSCSAGETIIEEGDSGDSIFLIRSGSTRVFSHILGKEIELAILSAGDVFGEVAFLTGRPRTASVIALDNTEIFEFNKLLLEEIFEKYPDVFKKLHDFYECRVQDTVEKVKTNLKK